jgi:predicted GNAT family acetyltransferase
MSEPAITVADNPAANRYEIHVNGELAGFTTYRLEPGRIVFRHMETLDAFAGKGLGARQAAAVLDDARARGLRVVPQCPFIKTYVADHPEYQDLVD